MATQYVGSIKNWNPTKGWGFIECQETHATFGKDIFVMRSALPDGTCNQGDQVFFSVQHGRSGPEAAGVQMLSAPGGQRKALIPSAAQSMGQAQYGGAAEMQQQQISGAETFLGFVKSWNPTAGWGFIECAQTQTMYGKDVFVMKSQVPGGTLGKGDGVQFAVRNGSKGVEACQVMIIGGVSGMNGGGGHQGGMAGAMGGGGQGGKAHGQVFFGSIKGFNEEKGWGHISCDESRKLYGRDIFLMRSALNGQPVMQGQEVTFKIGDGAKGPEAKDVTVLAASAISTDVSSGMVFAGTVKNYDSAKSYGFITGDQVRQIFGKDIFVHGRELEGFAPSQGTELEFRVRLAGDGRPEAFCCAITGAQPMQGGQRYAPY